METLPIPEAGTGSGAIAICSFAMTEYFKQFHNKMHPQFRYSPSDYMLYANNIPPGTRISQQI
jgi:hypothetical protein